MAADDPGFGTDQATGAFRRLLNDAAESEQSRVDALVVLSQRTVFAATWPGRSQDVRTLTNTDGEIAMPLFTGRDVLDSTAVRFGWLNADGSLNSRELGAREALRHAIEQNVHFVVLDIGTNYAAEFRREEIEPLLGMRRDSIGPYAAAGGPGDALTDAVRQSSRAPAGFSDASPSLRPPRVPSVEMDRPFARDSDPIRSAAPRPATGQDSGFPRADAVREMPSVPPTRPLGQGPSGSVRPPSISPAPPDRVPNSAKLPDLSGPRDLDDPPPVVRSGAEPVANPAALEAAAMVKSLARASGDADAQKAAAEVAALLQQSAAGGGDVSQEDRSEAEAAARQMAAMLSDGGPAQAQAQAPQPAPAPQPVPPAAAPATAAVAAPMQGAALVPLEVPLSDELLDGISDQLRQFPEVEWACETSDGSPVPIVGLRVDPSFLNRVAEITAAITDTGQRLGAPLTVLLLTDPERMREARAAGEVFFPGRRRKVVR